MELCENCQEVIGVNVIPAIDLMNGKVVRLSRGDPATAKCYDNWGTPVEVALKWKAEGATRLHVIDLDAAFGLGNNTSVVAEIARASGLPVQVGGGIRTVEAVEQMLKLGVDYVILGALAFSAPDVIPRIRKEHGAGSVIVALDNREGNVMVEGWKTKTGVTMWDALEKFVNLGVTTFLITSIAQDGLLQGPDLETLSEACTYPGVKVIAAGGIGSLGDLVALQNVGVEGVVVGKALYEGRFTLKEAINIVEEN
jgi:phosphoribosylformimino-5-aminoimidazole carboxamide ribotide isomerase